MWKSFLVAFICLGYAPAVGASGAVDSAFKLCMLFDSTGLASAPCEVSGWGSSVDVKIDMNASEARDLCGKVAGMARSKGWAFDQGWKLKIFSPYSGDNTIAFCNL